MASITTQERNELTGLFIAMFNAAPGAGYLSEVVSAREKGASLLSIATNLASKPEFQATYPAFLTAQEFAARAVGNLLAPDTPAGAKTWATNWIVGKLNAGESAASVLTQAAQALMLTPNANYASAKALMANRIEVSNYYSVTQEQPSVDLATLQDVLDGVTSAPASVQAAKDKIDDNLEGDEFILTVGADDFTGTTGNDEFRALSVDANGVDATTLSAFDELDGGKGVDTLNIFSDGTNNVAGAMTNVVIKNIEIVNFNNTGAGFGAVDASKFQGATQLNQVGVASAVDKLGEGTTAGFKTLAAAALSVTAAASAASASVSLTDVDDSSSLKVQAPAAGKLSTVTISGAVVDGADAGSAVNAIALEVQVGKDVQTLTLNSSVDVTLTATKNGKDITTVNAAGSTGAIGYVAGTSVSSITTGDGKDNVTLSTVLNATTKTASLSTGKGDDNLVIAVDDSKATADAAVTVNAGDGNDTITVAALDVKLNINAGAGDDTVKLGAIDSVTEDDVIDGGAGTDILVADGKTLVAEDYILLNEVIVGFETLRFENKAASVDGSRIASYKAIEFHGGASTAEKIAADQKLFTSVNLKAVAVGDETAGKSWAGTLDITSTASLNVEAHSETVKLTVISESDNDGSVDTAATVLLGDVKTASVVLQSNTDTKGDTDPSNDVQDVASVIVNADGANLSKLTTLTISGNGTAFIDNDKASSLTLVDASGLNSTNHKGAASKGLEYSSNNAAAETIKLGAGIDTVTLLASTYKATDTLQGLNLVAQSGSPTKVDTTKSDDLSVGTTGFVKTTVTGGSLGLALTNAATSADGNKIVFAFGGNTYIYHDVGTPDVLDDGDLLVKLVGTVNLDLLVDALNF